MHYTKTILKRDEVQTKFELIKKLLERVRRMEFMLVDSREISDFTPLSEVFYELKQYYNPFGLQAQPINPSQQYGRERLNEQKWQMGRSMG